MHINWPDTYPMQVPMPYPSAIFIREHAIIVNLESIKMLICKDQVRTLCCPVATLCGLAHA